MTSSEFRAFLQQVPPRTRNQITHIRATQYIDLGALSVDFRDKVLPWILSLLDAEKRVVAILKEGAAWLRLPTETDQPIVHQIFLLHPVEESLLEEDSSGLRYWLRLKESHSTPQTASQAARNLNAQWSEVTRLAYVVVPLPERLVQYQTCTGMPDNLYAGLDDNDPPGS